MYVIDSQKPQNGDGGSCPAVVLTASGIRRGSAAPLAAYQLKEGACQPPQRFSISIIIPP